MVAGMSIQKPVETKALPHAGASGLVYYASTHCEVTMLMLVT